MRIYLDLREKASKNFSFAFIYRNRKLTQVWDAEIILKQAREGPTIELQRRYSYRYHDRHFDKPSLIFAGYNSQQNHNSVDYLMSLDTVMAYIIAVKPFNAKEMPRYGTDYRRRKRKACDARSK